MYTFTYVYILVICIYYMYTSLLLSLLLWLLLLLLAKSLVVCLCVVLSYLSITFTLAFFRCTACPKSVNTWRHDVSGNIGNRHFKIGNGGTVNCLHCAIGDRSRGVSARPGGDARTAVGHRSHGPGAVRRASGGQPNHNCEIAYASLQAFWV